MRSQLSSLWCPSIRLRAIGLLFAAMLFDHGPGSLAQEPPEVDAAALADGLLKLQGDEKSWALGAANLPFCLSIGISEERFWSRYPGINRESFPPIVLQTLRAGTAGLPAWRKCVDDRRPTGIVENDLFGGGSSPKAPKVTCGEVAAVVFASLLPSPKLPEFEEPAVDKKKRLDDAAAANVLSEPPPLTAEQLAAVRNALFDFASKWEQQVRVLTPEERMKAWYAAADGDQRRGFLARVIQMEHEPAYPLIEADFRARAKNPDDFLELEVSAYVRHRRTKAKSLVDDLIPLIRKRPKTNEVESREFFIGIWTELVRYESLAAVLAAQPADKLDETSLTLLLYGSIDQPWAYHSAAIEPVGVSMRTLERSLQELVAGAAQTENLDRRLAMLEFAVKVADLLTETWHRVSAVERPTTLQSDAPERGPMTRQLRELFRDGRIGFRGDRVATPAQKAAEIVWELWHPSGQEYDAELKGYRRDWRTGAMSMQAGSARSTIVDLAEHVLARPEGDKVVDFPRAEAAKLAAEFTGGSAAEWRKKIDALPWERRLLVHAAVNEDRKIAARFWPRYVELVDWTGPKEGELASFAALWRDNLAGRKLDETTWAALQTWLTAEAGVGRYWAILGESYPMKPGVSLFVAPTHVFPIPDEMNPTLECELHGPYQNMGSSEFFRLVGGQREPDLEMTINTDLPAPMTALQKQLKEAAANSLYFCRNGFRFALIVRPPSKK